MWSMFPAKLRLTGAPAVACSEPLAGIARLSRKTNTDDFLGCRRGSM